MSEELNDDTVIGHLVIGSVCPCSLAPPYRSALERGWRMRWHKWPEEKPERKGAYWVRLFDHPRPYQTVSNSAPWVAVYRRGRWFDARGIDNPLPVTHWMHMPEPPEDEG